MRRLASIAAALVGGGLALAAAGGSGTGSAALVATDGITLRAEAGFSPRALPRRAYVPIAIRARATIHTRGPGLEQALRRLRIDFSRNGRVFTRGLPVCRPGRLAGTDPATARARCRGALVATGRITAGVEPPGGGRFRIGSPLSVFNGPRSGGVPTVIFHAHSSVVGPETYLVSARLERPRRGSRRGLRATIDVPAIAGGYGYLRSVSLRVNRRWRRHGRAVGYAMARCPDSRLGAHGRFEFADGTVIDGEIVRFCATLRG